KLSLARSGVSLALMGAIIFLASGCGEADNSAVGAEAVESRAQWSEDYPSALASARETNQPVFLLFTGSDWCPPCMQLEEKVFSSPVFAQFAEENMVLMKADFPRGEQDESIAKQNAGLQRQYPIQGFPTVMLLHPQT